jgi:hypothetical protein
MLAFVSKLPPLAWLRGVTHILDLVLIEIGDSVDHHPGKTSAKVDDFVQDKAHDACRQSIVLHP